MNMLASTSSNTALGGWTMLLLSKIKTNRIVSSSSFSFRISATCDNRPHGPSCIYVDPLQTATKETHEALYSQVRDAYYRGEPLIVNDMFDRVKLKLKCYGSKSVVKNPRCSIRRQSTYVDAEIAGWGADGVIVGSAIVKVIGDAKSPQEGLKEPEIFTHSLKSALD